MKVSVCNERGVSLQRLLYELGFYNVCVRLDGCRISSLVSVVNVDNSLNS